MKGRRVCCVGGQVVREGEGGFSKSPNRPKLAAETWELEQTGVSN